MKSATPRWQSRSAIGWIIAAIGVGYAMLLVYVWDGRTEVSVASSALGEPRKATVYRGDAAVTIFSLDGEKARHGLMPAAHGAALAWLAGRPPPLFVAVHSQASRDTDFRPARVTPAAWRPNISGRAPAFDVFLTRELRREIEMRFGRARAAYLFGHSLAGYYALGLPTRTKQHGFAGIFAFSPTFSHDLSLIDRLGDACAATPELYANVGWESDRDTAVFERAATAAGRNDACGQMITFERHPGMIHQVIMLTGQVAAYRSVFARKAPLLTTDRKVSSAATTSVEVLTRPGPRQ